MSEATRPEMPPRAVCDRRGFLQSVALSGGALLLGGAAWPARGAVRTGDEVLRIGLVVPATAEGQAAARGATLGAEEAARAAELMGRRLALATAEAAEPAAVAEAGTRLLREARVFALLGGFDETSASTLGEVAEREQALFLNLGSPSDALRGERCRRSTFHVQASEAMYRDALAQWQAAGEGSAGGGERATLWHPELDRFGAGQLNDRFHARFEQEMEPLAWAGWMAVKILWESAARTRATDAGALLDFLESGRARFDGHKGIQLSFRRWDHQLRQPLYIVRPGQDAGAVVGEVPLAARGGEQSPQELLDRLGTAESESPCTFRPL